MNEIENDVDKIFEYSYKEETVFFDKEPGSLELAKKILKIVNLAAREEKKKCGVLNIIIGDDRSLQKLNHSFRGIDAPTDVLSFNLYDEIDINKESNAEKEEKTKAAPVVEGDIYISRDRAIAQALEFSHSYEDEIFRLVVHGFLHLCGWNHPDDVSLEKIIARGESIIKMVLIR